MQHILAPLPLSKIEADLQTAGLNRGVELLVSLLNLAVPFVECRYSSESYKTVAWCPFFRYEKAEEENNTDGTSDDDAAVRLNREPTCLYRRFFRFDDPFH